jgi:hypothetical protein
MSGSPSGSSSSDRHSRSPTRSDPSERNTTYPRTSMALLSPRSSPELLRGRGCCSELRASFGLGAPAGSAEIRLPAGVSPTVTLAIHRCRVGSQDIPPSPRLRRAVIGLAHEQVDILRDRGSRDQPGSALGNRPQSAGSDLLVDDRAAQRQQPHRTLDPVQPARPDGSPVEPAHGRTRPLLSCVCMPSRVVFMGPFQPPAVSPVGQADVGRDRNRGQGDAAAWPRHGLRSRDPDVQHDRPTGAPQLNESTPPARPLRARSRIATPERKDDLRSIGSLILNAVDHGLPNDRSEATNTPPAAADPPRLRLPQPRLIDRHGRAHPGRTLPTTLRKIMRIDPRKRQ